MPSKNRRMLFSLGSIDVGDASDEFDLSSATHAFLHMKRVDAGTSVTVHFEASPQPFGTTPTWHSMRELSTVPISQTTSTRIQLFTWDSSWVDTIVTYIPICASVLASGYGALDSPVPQRMRIRVTGSTGLDWAYIEGLRSIA